MTRIPTLALTLTLALLCLFFLGGLARAEAPWTVAGTLRDEAARIDRLLYRAESDARDKDIAMRLSRMQAALAASDPAFGTSVGAALHDLAQAAEAGKGGDTARARQRLWSALTGEARDQTLAAIAAGDASQAARWLTIRDFPRASGETAASLAVQALSRGEMTPAEARTVVEAELLGVAASELRLALTAGAEDAAAGRMTQYAGDLGRIAGLVGFLRPNLTDRLGAEAMRAFDADLARASTEPAALAGLARMISGYAPVRLPPDEALRRARLFRRFTALVWQEYRDGVRHGEISQPVEYHEARLFRDRAAMLWGDLIPQMPDTAATERLSGLMAALQAEIAVRGDGVEPLVAEALALIDATFGAEVTQGGYQAALDALPAALDELALMARSGDWAGAELKRLEAYSWFDPDIEQRLVPRAPAMALRLEARFWEGTAARPGLGQLIAARVGPAALGVEIAGIKTDLELVEAEIGRKPSTFGVVLQSAGILFREGLEAVLILAALLAALRAEGHDLRRFRPAVATGVVLALGFSLALWAAARSVLAIPTLAREAIEGGTAVVAAVVLVWLVLGFAAGGGQVARFRARLAGRANPVGVAMLAFLVVFREGFETVLFYEALLVDAAAWPVLAGLAAGGVAALAIGWAVLASGRRLPLRLFFRVTTVLLAALAVMLTGAGLRGLQSAALVPATPVAWFPDHDWLQLWFGLFPVMEPLAAQAVVLMVLLLPAVLRPPVLRPRAG